MHLCGSAAFFSVLTAPESGSPYTARIVDVNAFHVGQFLKKMYTFFDENSGA